MLNAKFRSALALLVFLALAGCSPKSATEMAIKASETSYNAVKGQIESVMPAEAKSIEDTIAQARADMDKGDYKAAVDGVKDVPKRIEELTAQAAQKKAELETSWGELAAAVPTGVAALEGGVEKVATMKKLPKGIETTSVETAKTALENAKKAWSDAETAQGSGKLYEAVAKAGEAKQAVQEGMTALNLPMPSTLTASQ
ncbi:MAG: hypothetical protein ACREOU_05165 [Candidatus Eiseniibacteriota bacterium]